MNLENLYTSGDYKNAVIKRLPPLRRIIISSKTIHFVGERK